MGPGSGRSIIIFSSLSSNLIYLCVMNMSTFTSDNLKSIILKFNLIYLLLYLPCFSVPESPQSQQPEIFLLINYLSKIYSGIEPIKLILKLNIYQDLPFFFNTQAVAWCQAFIFLHIDIIIVLSCLSAIGFGFSLSVYSL